MILFDIIHHFDKGPGIKILFIFFNIFQEFAVFVSAHIQISTTNTVKHKYGNRALL